MSKTQKQCPIFKCGISNPDHVWNEVEKCSHLQSPTEINLGSYTADGGGEMCCCSMMSAWPELIAEAGLEGQRLDVILRLTTEDVTDE